MNKQTAVVLTGVVAAMLMAPHAQAQCPVAPLSPLSTVSGTWTFSTDGFAVTNFLSFFASGGRFTASVGADRNGNPIGVLTVTQTSAVNGSITRLETAAGRYLISSDCSAGTLIFNTGSLPIQFDFWLVNGGEMVMVSSSTGDAVSGTARLSAPVACSSPAIGAITGTWIFSVEDFDFVRNIPEFTAAGRLVISPAGVLNVTETAAILGSGTSRVEGDTGKAFVNDDCQGGYLSFNVAGRSIQFDYFFAGPNRMVLSAASAGDIVTGEARRLGSL